MCGIAGIYHLQTAKPVEEARVRAMADAIAHRGPDGDGVWVAPGVGLGHRRLAIIDLVGGVQPMASDDGQRIFVQEAGGELFQIPVSPGQTNVSAELPAHFAGSEALSFRVD